MQRRMALHLHIGIRGAVSRQLLRQVTAGTYYQRWWPPTDAVVYPAGGAMPVWDEQTHNYVDPHTGTPLTRVEQACDDLAAHPDALPWHTMQFGAQMDIQGVPADSPTAAQRIGYMTKYLTKDVGQVHPARTGTAQTHQHRLADELRFTPCSLNCPNWLRYGYAPKCGKVKFGPGFCRGKVHSPDTLGIGGRRVLVSRQWSGKTLAEHRHDRWAVVQRLIALAHGRDPAQVAEQIELSRQGQAKAPYTFTRARPGQTNVPDLNVWISQQIATRQRHWAAIREHRANDPPGIPPDAGGGGDAAIA
jgi:hypothetical protein